MDKQQQAPVLQPFFIDDRKQVSPIWQRWFQKLKIRDDEIRRKPYKIYTDNATLTTWDLGKTIMFNIGASDRTCNLPTPGDRDLWAWIQIVRMGAGRLTITADASSRIEYSSEGGSAYCQETRRRAANITLQLVAASQWAIISGLGIWDID